MMTPIFRDDDEPTATELAGIEAEWPQIEADLAVLDAEIRVVSAHGGPSALDWRRLRRAQRQSLTAHSRSLAVPADDVAQGVA